MRPRKKILLIDADETRRGILAYALDINRFAVRQCGSVKMGAAEIRQNEFDLILGQWPLPADLYSRLCLKSTCAVLTVVGNGDQTCAENGQIMSPTTEDLLDRIAFLAAGKRGPKKGFQPKWGFKKLTAA